MLNRMSFFIMTHLKVTEELQEGLRFLNQIDPKEKRFKYPKNDVLSALKDVENRLQAEIDSIRNYLNSIDLSDEALRGKSGKDGYTPVKGVDYPGYNAINEFIESQVEEKLSNVTIEQPSQEKNYFTEEDKENIAKMASALVEVPEIDEMDVAITSINLLERFSGDDRLDAKAIKNLESNIDVGKLDFEVPDFSVEEFARDLERLEGDDRLDYAALKNTPNLDQISSRVGTGGGNLAVFSSSGKVGSGTRLKFTGNAIDSITHDGNLGTVNVKKTLDTVTVTSATYSTTADASLIFADTTSNAITITLSSDDVVAGREIVVKDSGGNSSTNKITIDTEGSETIDGEDDVVINDNYNTVSVHSDGSNWFIT